MADRPIEFAIVRLRNTECDTESGVFFTSVPPDRDPGGRRHVHLRSDHHDHPKCWFRSDLVNHEGAAVESDEIAALNCSEETGLVM